MQIHYNQKIYKVRPDIELWLIEAIDDWALELITKPEEKPDHDKAMDEVHWVEEDIPDRTCWWIECAWCDYCDKAMEIPEVPEYKLKSGLYTREDIQLEAITTSLNLLIKAHNNK